MPKKSSIFKKLKTVILVIVGLLTLNILSAFVYPSVSDLEKTTPDKSAFMEYRERQWAREGAKTTMHHTFVPISRISPNMTKAVIIAEDDKFWGHAGFDFEGMEKALEKDIKKKKFKAGGSTISQQLAKNLFLSPSKNPVRKIKEAILTWRMERALSKRRILELYLNFAEWGDGIFGIEAAARHYYGCSAASLSAQQASRLATVLPNPIKFSPVNPGKYVSRRSAIIYRIMARRGIVIPEFESVMHPDAPVAAPSEVALDNQSGIAPAEAGRDVVTDYSPAAPGAER